MAQIKALIFDCFGVLLTDALAGMVSELRAFSPDKADRIVRTIEATSKGSLSPEESRTIVAGLLGLPPDEYAERIRTGEVRNNELFRYILELRQHYKTALLSNVSSRGLEVRFAPGELARYFDTVVASGVIGYAKPEPEAYEITAGQLGVRLDECVMIDDREAYCEGARAVGMQAVRYESFAQLQDALAAVDVRAKAAA